MASQAAASARPPFPARVGALLASPRAALAAIDARRWATIPDGMILVLLGALAFRLEDLARAARGGGLLTIGRQVLVILGQELRTAAIVVILTGVAITLLAGKGRRDPGWDIELAAAAWVPFFAGQAALRLLDLPPLGGPLPRPLFNVLGAIVLAWFAVVVVLAVRVARARPAPGDRPVPDVRTRDRLAAAALGALLGGALALSLAGTAGAPRAAPAFTLARVDGQGALSLADLRGKVVLLDFWASWCAPCVQMMPTLHDLYAEFRGKGVEFVGINSDASPEDARAFLASRPAPYPNVLDDGEVGGRYKVVALPHMVVLGRDHTIRRVFWGLTTRGELAAALEQAAR